MASSPSVPRSRTRRSVTCLSVLSALLSAPSFILGCGAGPAGSPAGASESQPTAAPPIATPGDTPRDTPTTDAPDAATPETKKESPERPLNVLLILVDSMRADMPWAGYPREIAPNLTELEKNSVSYTRGYSISSYTAKSVGGLLAGKYPSSLRRSGYFFTKYSDSDLFFPELLQEAGVRTLSGHAHMYMKRGNLMDQGFDDWRVVPGLDFDAKTDNHITSHKLTPMAIEQLGTVPADKPFFMYLHYMDPHDVYMTHKEAPDWGKSARDRYDQEMFYTDIWIGKLLEHCRAQPWWSKTAVIVSADHGEGFGEHHVYRHAFALWEMLTQVPLFIHLPEQPGRRIDTPRSAIDLAPTILDLMGVEAPPGEFVGHSLVEELYGREEPKPRPVHLDLPADSNNPRVRAMIHGDYKLMVYDKGWRKDLYNLKTDPGEKKDLAKAEPERFKEMVELFEAEWSKIKQIQPYGGNKLVDGSYANGPS
ncbi:MAG: sulfatase-like hydrolase/transferase [Polyangiaceae bacterium]|nr:sulfatase-like hydrolase/transferase [Polyangiaceae bacterium]MCW5791458.1 sulfatase-like hydrolase/transferase [Polyangiaceae bacterium]